MMPESNHPEAENQRLITEITQHLRAERYKKNPTSVITPKSNSQKSILHPRQARRLIGVSLIAAASYLSVYSFSEQQRYYTGIENRIDLAYDNLSQANISSLQRQIRLNYPKLADDKEIAARNELFITKLKEREFIRKLETEGDLHPWGNLLIYLVSTGLLAIASRLIIRKD